MQLLRLLVVLAKLALAPVRVRVQVLLLVTRGAMHQSQWRQNLRLMMHGQTLAFLQWAMTHRSKTVSNF
jgi:hypothetical protein